MNYFMKIMKKEGLPSQSIHLFFSHYRVQYFHFSYRMQRINKTFHIKLLYLWFYCGVIQCGCVWWVVQIWVFLSFLYSPGAVVSELGGPCGFRWPIAVWEVWLLVAVGLTAYRKCPLPVTHTLAPCKKRPMFPYVSIMRYTSRAVYLQALKHLCVLTGPPFTMSELMCLQSCPQTGMLTTTANREWSFLGPVNVWQILMKLTYKYSITLCYGLHN